MLQCNPLPSDGSRPEEEGDRVERCLVDGQSLWQARLELEVVGGVERVVNVSVLRVGSPGTRDGRDDLLESCDGRRGRHGGCCRNVCMVGVGRKGDQRFEGPEVVKMRVVGGRERDEEWLLFSPPRRPPPPSSPLLRVSHLVTSLATVPMTNWNGGAPRRGAPEQSSPAARRRRVDPSEHELAQQQLARILWARQDGEFVWMAGLLQPL